MVCDPFLQLSQTRGFCVRQRKIGREGGRREGGREGGRDTDRERERD
jgi:hypothetical protein